MIALSVEGIKPNSTFNRNDGFDHSGVCSGKISVTTTQKTTTSKSDDYETTTAGYDITAKQPYYTSRPSSEKTTIQEDYEKYTTEVGNKYTTETTTTATTEEPTTTTTTEETTTTTTEPTTTSTTTTTTSTTPKVTTPQPPLVPRPSGSGPPKKYFENEEYDGNVGASTNVNGRPITAMQASELFEDFDRSLGSKFQYGCWCNFKEKPYLYRGHGEPVDVFDEACKQLEENYLCAQAQFKNKGITCDITGTTYSGKDMYNYYVSFSEIQKDCNKANPHPCPAKRCMIEKSFAMHVKILSQNAFIKIDKGRLQKAK